MTAYLSVHPSVRPQKVYFWFQWHSVCR